jgi:C1A family cysteine protease
MKLILVLMTISFFSSAFGANASEKALTHLKHLTHAADPRWTFTMKYNPMMEYPQGQITGVRQPADWKSKATFIRPKPQTHAALPASFDWRDISGGLTPIKNQGQCGSCWAFGTVGVMESVLRIKEGITRSFSEQYLMNCDTQSSGCSGGFYAHYLHQTPGAVLDSDVPYLEANDYCRDAPHQEKLDNWAYVGDQNSTPSVGDLKQAIFTYGPVAVTVTADSYFQAYNTGVYNFDDQSTTNHIVDLVGWNDSDGAWILRNSWGPEWGEKGYMRIRYGVSNVGQTATFVIYKPVCGPQPIPFVGESETQTVTAGQSVLLGGMPVSGQTYRWEPATGLDDPTSASPVATPTATTVYTLYTSSKCGSGVKSVAVTVN